MHEADKRFRDLVAERSGATSRKAARAIGMAGHRLERRIRNGTVLAPTSRVLVLEGAPATYELDAWIALTEAGDDAALSHDSCLALWGLPGFARYPIHVSTSRSVTRFELHEPVLHRTRFWPAHHRLVVNGLPMATPTRALFDVINADEMHPLKIERTVNTAWAKGLTSGLLLAKMAKEWCERGRTGSKWVHEYLDTHPVDWEPPASNLESRFSHLIVEAGMPEPKRQRNLGDDHSWIGRVDMLDPELPLVAEISSDRFHLAPMDAAADATRFSRLEKAGFVVVEFKEFEVWHRGDDVVERWRQARRDLRDKLR